MFYCPQNNQADPPFSRSLRPSVTLKTNSCKNSWVLQNSWRRRGGMHHSGELSFNREFTPYWGFPGSSAGKESTSCAGEPGLIPGSGRYPGEGKGYPLQYSGLENSKDCIVLGIAKSWTRLSDFHFMTFKLNNVSNQMNFILVLYSKICIGSRVKQ